MYHHALVQIQRKHQMPRVRSEDYEAKSRAILDSTAGLFAKVGYPNAKMQDIAQACRATKSMLYHYFPTKDDLLFAMLEEHLERLIDRVKEALVTGTPIKNRFITFVEIYAQKSARSRRCHVNVTNDMKFLPKAQQTRLLALKRKSPTRSPTCCANSTPTCPPRSTSPTP
jgi:AcrR family transcriptional regulator